VVSGKFLLFSPLNENLNSLAKTSSCNNSQKNIAIYKGSVIFLSSFPIFPEINLYPDLISGFCSRLFKEGVEPFQDLK